MAAGVKARFPAMSAGYGPRPPSQRDHLRTPFQLHANLGFVMAAGKGSLEQAPVTARFVAGLVGGERSRHHIPWKLKALDGQRPWRWGAPAPTRSGG